MYRPDQSRPAQSMQTKTRLDQAIQTRAEQNRPKCIEQNKIRPKCIDYIRSDWTNIPRSILD